MLVKEIMETNVSECTEDTPLKDVYALIQQSPRGFVVVIDSIKHRVPIGIVNEHSICENIVVRARRINSLDAGSVLSTNIKRLGQAMRIEDCGQLVDQVMDGIVVVDDRRQFCGIVMRQRLAEAIIENQQKVEKPAILSGILGHHVSAPVEIPAFGWLK